MISSVPVSGFLRHLAVVLLPVVAFPILSAAAAPAAEPRPRTVSVEGSASVVAVPDTAEVDIGVVTRHRDAAEAMAENAKAARAVVAALKVAGVSDGDIHTRNVSIVPVYTNDAKGRRPAIETFEARNDVHMRIKNLDSLGKLLSAAVTAGSNTLSGIRFSVADPDSLVAKAQIGAIQDAKAKAERYVKAAGAHLGRLVEVSEREVGVPVPMVRGFKAEATMAEVPVSPSTEELTVRVWTIWEIL